MQLTAVTPATIFQSVFFPLPERTMVLRTMRMKAKIFVELDEAKTPEWRNRPIT